MIKVKFNGSDAFIDVSFQRTSNHVVTLTGDVPASEVGFKTYRMDGVTQLGDFSDYTTVYRVLDDGCQYSNDGSVWHEPEPAPPTPPGPQPVSELEMLKKKVEAQGVLLDFYEECIAEMAEIVYA